MFLIILYLRFLLNRNKCSHPFRMHNILNAHSWSSLKTITACGRKTTLCIVTAPAPKCVDTVARLGDKSDSQCLSTRSDREGILGNNRAAEPNFGVYVKPAVLILHAWFSDCGVGFPVVDHQDVPPCGFPSYKYFIGLERTSGWVDNFHGRTLPLQWSFSQL
jgi:hypothetical protein